MITPCEEEMRRQALDTRQVRSGVGIAFIFISFLVYLAYPVILFLLPLSGVTKIAVIIAAAGVSWCVFCTGILLAGRQGYDWLKGQWRR